MLRLKSHAEQETNLHTNQSRIQLNALKVFREVQCLAKILEHPAIFVVFNIFHFFSEKSHYFYSPSPYNSVESLESLIRRSIVNQNYSLRKRGMAEIELENGRRLSAGFVSLIRPTC